MVAKVEKAFPLVAPEAMVASVALVAMEALAVSLREDSLSEARVAMVASVVPVAMVATRVFLLEDSPLEAPAAMVASVVALVAMAALEDSPREDSPFPDLIEEDSAFPSPREHVPCPNPWEDSPFPGPREHAPLEAKSAAVDMDVLAVATAILASPRVHTAHTGLSLTRDPELTTVSKAPKPRSVSTDPRLLLVSTVLASTTLRNAAASVSMAPLSPTSSRDPILINSDLSLLTSALRFRSAEV